MAVAAILNSKNFIFRSCECNLGSISDVVYQISLKSDNFTLRYGDLTIFKMTAVRHLDFENLQFLSCGLRRHAVLLSHTKFRRIRTIGR